jgi:hypothetical protein
MRKINPTALFVILLGITALILFCILTNGHNWGDDFSSYIMQAKSITELNPRCFIEANRFTVENSSYHYGAPIAYPWGFPVLLAPFYAVFGLNMIGLKLLGVISFLIFIVLIWVGFRKYHSPVWLLCLVCFFSLNPNMLSFTDQILSDLPFLLLSTASVLFMGRLIIEKRNLISPVWDYILLGVIISGAFFIRASGVLLLMTLAITQFIALALRLRQGDFPNGQCSTSFRKLLSDRGVFLKDLLINLIPYISFFCIVLLWEAIMPKGLASYPSYLSNAVSINDIKQNLDYYIDLPAEFFIGVPHFYLFYFAGIPIAITGIIRRYRSDYHIIVYIILIFVLYILGSSPKSLQGLRYLFPILPFYYSFVITGLEIFQGGKTNIEQKLRKWVCLIPILIVLTYFVISSAGNAYSNMIHHRETISGPYTATSQGMFSFIKSNTEKESTIVFFKPRLMRMMTGRKSIMLRTKVELLRGDYLCVYLAQVRDQVSPDTVQDLLKKQAVLLIYENSEFKVYKLTYSKIPLMNR